jgi:hypothetical protein
MKKLIFIVTVGVVAMAGGVGAAFLVNNSGSASALCVEGFNYQTNLSLAEYQTSPAGPLIGVYKNQQPWLLMYPVIKLSNVADRFNTTAPAFTTQAGFQVYAPGQTPPGASIMYAVNADMPFLIMAGGPGAATDAEVRAFLEGLKPQGACPSPNPGEYDPDAAEKAEHAAQEAVACKDVQIAVVQTQCEKYNRESVPEPGTFSISYEASAQVKNEGTAPLTELEVEITNARGAGAGGGQELYLAPGATGWIGPSFAMEDSAQVTVIPHHNDELCFSKKVSAPLSCANLPTLTPKPEITFRIVPGPITEAEIFDESRARDLYRIAQELELYYGQCRHYPGGASCDPVTGKRTMAQLRLAVGEMEGDMRIANDPACLQKCSDAENYQYASDGQEYILKTTFDNKQHVRLADSFTGSFMGITCNPTVGDFCIKF